MSTFKERVEAKIKEIEASLLENARNPKTSANFNPMEYVIARDEAGNQFLFESAFAYLWTEPESCVKVWLIFAEHADPVWIYVEDGAWCKQFIRTEIKRID